MKRVRLLKQVNNRREGEILRLDEKSAHSLVKVKQFAEYVDDDATSTEVRDAPRRGSVVAQQVAEPDDPNAVVGQPAEGETGEQAEVVTGDGETHTGTVPTETASGETDPGSATGFLS